MSAPRIPRSTRPKWIVAHFMVGNTYPYAVDDWQADIDLASDYGFDGFALNVGREDWQLARVADCFEAARRSLKPFKLFLSFDMASIPSGDRKDVALILGYLDRFARHPNYFVHASGIVVSTFAGQESFFGFPSLNEAWLHVKHAIEHCVKKPVHFIPSFFVDPRRYPSLTCMNGYFHWNGGWPLHLAPQSPRHEVHLPKLDSDQPHIAHLGRRTYMAAISPWFFTHYGRESWNKNWIYRSDDHLLIRRWEYLLSIRDDVDIVQFISWNDYGESHYISPPRGAQPNSQAWVDNCPHDSWLSLNSMFIQAFRNSSMYHKTDAGGVFNDVRLGLRLGTVPKETENYIWMWARPHSKYAIATNDSIRKPDNWELTDDLFWVVTVTSSTHPTTLKLSTGGSDPQSVFYQIPPSHEQDDESPQREQRRRRLSKFSHRLVPGESMRAELIREGRIVAACDPGPEFRFEREPRTYNFNAFVCTNLGNQ